MLRLSIPQPCHEDWNKMTPNEQGAFCKVCAKTVVDFTRLNDEEVKNYFLNNREQKTCGRFKNHQLTQPDLSIDTLLLQPIPLWKKFLAAVILLFGSLLSGCGNRTMGKMHVKEQSEIGITIINDSISTKLNSYTSEMEKPEECNTIKGETVPVIKERTITETAGVVVPLETITGDVDVSVTGGAVVVEIIPDKVADTLKPTNPTMSDEIITKKNCDTRGKKDTVYYKP